MARILAIDFGKVRTGLITASGMEQEIGGLIPSFIAEFWYIFLLAILFSFSFWKWIPSKKFGAKIKDLSYKSLIVYFFDLNPILDPSLGPYLFCEDKILASLTFCMFETVFESLMVILGI